MADLTSVQAIRDALVGKLADTMDPDNAAAFVAEFEQAVWNARHCGRCLIQGCYYGSDACVYCGAPRPSTAPLMGESPLQTLGRSAPGSREERKDRHRCGGCGLRWDDDAVGFIEPALPGVELCGDCWRKAQPILHGSDSVRHGQR
jgi:hypothetical protein